MNIKKNDIIKVKNVKDMSGKVIEELMVTIKAVSHNYKMIIVDELDVIIRFEQIEIPTNIEISEYLIDKKLY